MVALDLSRYTVLRSYYVGSIKMATITNHGNSHYLQVNYSRIIEFYEKQFYKALTK